MSEADERDPEVISLRESDRIRAAMTRRAVAILAEPAPVLVADMPRHTGRQAAAREILAAAGES